MEEWNGPIYILPYLPISPISLLISFYPFLFSFSVRYLVFVIQVFQLWITHYLCFSFWFPFTDTKTGLSENIRTVLLYWYSLRPLWHKWIDPKGPWSAVGTLGHGIAFSWNFLKSLNSDINPILKLWFILDFFSHLLHTTSHHYFKLERVPKGLFCFG